MLNCKACVQWMNRSDDTLEALQAADFVGGVEMPVVLLEVIVAFTCEDACK